jgi:adenylate cyclase
LWAESYEGNLSDVLGLQGDIARGIAQGIRIKLTPQELARLARARPINPSAHEAYLKGLYYLNKAINTSSLAEAEQPHRKSFEYFEQAISLEPNHAQAYAGLARSYHWLASAGKPEFFPKAKEAALKAIAIDDTLAEAHAALAYTIWNYEWDWAGAEKEYKRTKELNSSNMGEHGYALLLSAMGRHDEAIREMRLALDLEPLILQAKVNLGWIYLNGRQYDQAIEQFQGTLELNPDYAEAHTGLGTVYSGKGEHEKAIAEFQKAAALSRNLPAEKADLGWAYAKAGKRSEAIRILDELKSSSTQEKPVRSARSAVIYAALGEKDQAVMLLEKACAERERPLIWLKVALEFDDLRSHPRFTDLVRCVGIPQ